VDERIGLLATVDFSGHGISPSPMRLRITNSGLLGDSSFALVYECRCALRPFFLGGIAFKTLSYWQSLLKGPILERNGCSAIGPTFLSAPDVKKILTAYDMTMSWMQLLL
jgi:hypothetical protein